MSEHKNVKEFAPSQEDNAHETANTLLMDAVDAIGRIIPPHVNSPTTAILDVGHALVAKLDSMESTYINAMNDLRESLDFIAARHDANAASEVATEHEREVMYQALKADYFKRVGEVGSLCIIADGGMAELAAMRHFKKIAGL